MSSSTTHAIIGGVAGLALLRLAPELVPPALDQLTGGPGLVRDLAVLALTALLATWPDIEEPGSWIAQRVRGVCVLL
ncbi:MAG TPA: hypothetical protein VFS21_07480, partial [Roseiflexaceae bacterium]|nr:hypothetical protein [Roseiflexaceae bacterium]